MPCVRGTACAHASLSPSSVRHALRPWNSMRSCISFALISETSSASLRQHPAHVPHSWNSARLLILFCTSDSTPKHLYPLLLTTLMQYLYYKTRLTAICLCKTDALQLSFRTVTLQMSLQNSYIANVFAIQLHRKHDLRVLRKKRLRHIIALAGLSVDRHRCEAAFLPVGIFDRDVQLPAAEVLLDLKALPVSRSGRMPRIPSTQPTMTVEAVPVSQCTWDRPACGLALPSVNCP